MTEYRTADGRMWCRVYFTNARNRRGFPCTAVTACEVDEEGHILSHFSGYSGDWAALKPRPTGRHRFSNAGLNPVSHTEARR